MKERIEFVVNGKQQVVEIEPHKTLLDILRDELELTGTKRGCGEGECGSCTVLLDNRPVPSCLVLAPQVQGREVITIEGLAKGDELDPLQESFISHGAMQCGFCIPGMILSAKGLLLKNPSPTTEEIKDAISGNLCRCTGYLKIVQAIEAVAHRGERANEGGTP